MTKKESSKKSADIRVKKGSVGRPPSKTKERREDLLSLASKLKNTLKSMKKTKDAVADKKHAGKKQTKPNKINGKRNRIEKAEIEHEISYHEDSV